MAERVGARDAAARVVAGVIAGRSVSDLLPGAAARVVERDRGLTQELVFGTLRWQPRLAVLLEKMLDRPLKDPQVEALLWVGLYQLSELGMPAHAAVNETVQATARLGKGWARGLVNGVLRRYQREGQALRIAALRGEPGHSAHPDWLRQRLQQDWPSEWPAIVEANNARPPMTIRLNRNRTTRPDYIHRLQEAGLAARPNRHAADALTLDTPVPVEKLPGFREGQVSVQDAAAQLAAGLLAPGAGHRVLDACAAPGGKTAHLLELCPEAQVLALDQDAERLIRIGENLDRLGLRAEVRAGDAGQPEPWWDGVPFDRILLDAPCSGTGVIRRHPDIKLLRRDTDVAELAAGQHRLLHALWPLLKPGGMLVYATCSVLRDENDRQIARFLQDVPSALEQPIEASWGIAVAAGRQILPGQDAMDGFYYARLVKQ